MGLSSNSFKKIIILPPGISVSELKELVEIHQVDEVICNSKDLGMNNIIGLMVALGDKIEFKITGDETLGIIGSQSKNKSGEIYTVKVNYDIQETANARIKRTIDVTVSILLLILSPILWILGKKVQWFQSLFGQKTIVGYDLRDENIDLLPSLKPGIIPISSSNDNKDQLHSINKEYAMQYQPRKDLRRIYNYLRA